LDFRALKAGRDVEFEFDPAKEDDAYDWDDEMDVKDRKLDYKHLFNHRNSDVLYGGEETAAAEEGGEENDAGKTKSDSSQTPFEMLRARMEDITPEKDGGVFKRVIIPGSGLVIPKESRVRLHYNAYFELNDEPFDSTYLRNKSFEFKLGANQVVRGMDISVATMKKHEKAQFIFQPTYYMGDLGCK
jgi:FKBP-type peptidyl-prolyl cis-trans isomerase